MINSAELRMYELVCKEGGGRPNRITLERDERVQSPLRAFWVRFEFEHHESIEWWVDNQHNEDNFRIVESMMMQLERERGYMMIKDKLPVSRTWILK